MKRISYFVLSILFLSITMVVPVSAQDQVECEEGDIKCFVDQIPASDSAFLEETQQDDSFRLGLQMMIGFIGAAASAYAFKYVRKKNSDSEPEQQEDPLKKALSLDP